MAVYKPQSVANLINQSPSTVRAWSAEFNQYLSPGAAPEAGHRVYTAGDVRILLVIADMRRAGRSREEIRRILDSLAANEWKDLPPLPERSEFTADSVPVMPIEAAERALSGERMGFLREIEALRNQLSDLRQELAAARESNTALLREIGDLQAKLARAEYEAHLYASGRLKPHED